MKIFFKHKQLFNLSNYPRDSHFFDETNKQVIDKMNDQSEGLKSRIKVKDVLHEKK